MVRFRVSGLGLRSRAWGFGVRLERIFCAPRVVLLEADCWGSAGICLYGVRVLPGEGLGFTFEALSGLGMAMLHQGGNGNTSSGYLPAV